MLRLIPFCCRRNDGCTGGVTLDEACELVAQWHEEQAALWRSQRIILTYNILFEETEMKLEPKKH